jgi:adenine phosphoribosyltransferase
MDSKQLEKHLRSLIRDIDDFPQPGIIFKDITPLLLDPQALKGTVQLIADPYRQSGIDAVIGIESRGFILGAPVALELNCGFVPVRKPGKLPAPTQKQEYQLEYGSDAIEIHLDAVQPGQKVILVDDVLATGGTMQAAYALVKSLGAEVVGLAFLMELGFLGGAKKLEQNKIHSLIKY